MAVLRAGLVGRLALVVSRLALVVGTLATSASAWVPQRREVCVCVAPSCQFDAPVGGGWIFEPALLSRLPPGPYRSAMVVVLEIRVDERGRVTHACVLRGLDAARDADAIAVVKRWRYAPATLSRAADGRPAGTPIPIAITVLVPAGA